VKTGFLAKLVVLMCLEGCASAGLAPDGSSPKPAPDFSLPTTGGKRIVLSSLKGQVVVIDFWATWCDSCPQALAHLQTIARHGLVPVPVDEQENARDVRAFIDAKQLTLNVALDSDGSTATTFGVISLPTTIVIGRDGLVRAVIRGWNPDTATQIDPAVALALGAPVPSAAPTTNQKW
jgi:cytochrome c biogenesis protein CcmG, thiol:disulfide interchange protein DsbE